MLDLKLLQKDFDEVSQKLLRKKVKKESLDELRRLSLELKEKKQALELLQAEQNAKSKLFGVYAKEGKDINELKKELAQNKELVSKSNDALRVVEEQLSMYALTIPNIPDDSVPDGEDEDDNVELKKVCNHQNLILSQKSIGIWLLHQSGLILKGV